MTVKRKDEIERDPATCRGCGKLLKGDDFRYGGVAYHPASGKQCKVNHYGGYVCSEPCDYRSSLDLERTMPGHGWQQQKIGQSAMASYHRNWGTTHDR